VAQKIGACCYIGPDVKIGANAIIQMLRFLMHLLVLTPLYGLVALLESVVILEMIAFILMQLLVQTALI
jgi:hypothetical protein